MSAEDTRDGTDAELAGRGGSGGSGGSGGDEAGAEHPGEAVAGGKSGESGESGETQHLTAVGAPMIPAQNRVQSDEELLEQDDVPRERTALARLGSLRGAGGFGRAVQVVASAAALALVAVLSGTLAHDTDVHSAATGANQRVLMRLVGAGPELTLSRDGGHTGGEQSVGVQMLVTVRNDGARAERIVAADIEQSGVVLDRPVAALTVKPGQSQAIGLHLTVSCDRVDLPEYPDSVTLDLRDPDGRPTRQVFPFHPGHQTPPVSGAVTEFAFLDPLAPGSSFFAMCSEVIQESDAPSTFLGMVGLATPTDPTIRYRLRVEGGSQWARILSAGPDARALEPLGLTATTDLTAPVRIDAATPHTVTVSEHVTDCTTAERAIAGLGLANYVAQAREGVGLGTEAADSRFQQVGPLPIGFFQDGSASPDGTTSAFAMTFIQQLAAACPTLR